VDVVGKNMPGELMFIVPDSLSPGDYTLVVRAGFGEDDVRTGALEATEATLALWYDTHGEVILRSESKGSSLQAACKLSAC
jgi:hypothetical protein